MDVSVHTSYKSGDNEAGRTCLHDLEDRQMALGGLNTTTMPCCMPVSLSAATPEDYVPYYRPKASICLSNRCSSSGRDADLHLLSQLSRSS